MTFSTLSALLGILGGSLGTLIISSIINYFSKKTEFKNELMKLTYERKLQIAENAIGFYSYYRFNSVHMYNSMEAITMAAEKMGSEDGGEDSDVELIISHMNRLGLIITEMFNSKYQEILSMNLYFDFSDEDHTSENLLNFFVALGDAKAMDDNIGFWAQRSTQEIHNGNMELSGQYWQKAMEQMPAYINAIKKVSSLLKIDTQSSYNIIRTIKSQIEMY